MKRGKKAAKLHQPERRKKSMSIAIGSRVERARGKIIAGTVTKKDGVQGDLFLSVNWDNGTTSQLHEMQVNAEGTFKNILNGVY